MELPHLGQHCNESQCNRLDFLPIKCDGCNKVFCNDHYLYDNHNCPVAYQKNVQVPVCPLCNAIIPGRADELPDIRVSRHIDSDCRSDTAMTRRKTVFTNRCSLKGCKQKELVPVLCDKCSLNYCLRHRHPQDHSCTNSTAKGVSKGGLAALSRMGHGQGQGQTNPQTSRPSIAATAGAYSRSILSNITGARAPSNNPPVRSVSALQGNISEEDALRMALEASMSGQGATVTTPTALSQEQEDFLLAKALAESEMTAAGGEQNSTNRRSQPSCDIC